MIHILKCLKFSKNIIKLNTHTRPILTSTFLRQNPLLPFQNGPTIPGRKSNIPSQVITLNQTPLFQYQNARNFFIRTQDTPNPDSLMFLPG